MAKLAFSLAFFVGLLFAFSHASTGSDSDPTRLEFPVEKPASETQKTYFVVKIENSETEQPPLTLIRFRPVDRRFKRRPFPMTFRRGRDIPYGNDMILSSDEPTHHVEPRFPIMHGEEDEWKPRHHHRRHHHHGREHDHDEFDHPHHHHDHEYDHDEYHHGHGHGFMRSFRKFLGHF